MMKKVWLVLLAVVFVFGFAVLGCGGGGSSNSGNPNGEGNNFTSDLTGLSGDLIKNQYAEDKDDSRGLQLKFDNKALMNGKKVLKDDEITLKIKFKLSKPLAYDLEIGFVDTTVDGSEGYWRTLTWDKDDKNDGMYKIDKSKLGTADTEVEDEIKLKAVKDASSASAAANTLVFESRDSWSKDPVKITFVSFLVVFGSGGTEPPPPPPPPPTDQVFAVKVGTKTVNSTVVGIGGEVEAIQGGFVYTAETPNWQANYACFSVDLGDLTLGEIGKVTFTAKGIKGDSNNKDLELWAKTTPIAGAQWSSAPQVQFAMPNAASTADGADLEFEIDAGKIATLGVDEESTLYFVIYMAVGGHEAGSYQITNITFVEGDPVAPTPPPEPPEPPTNDDFFVFGPFDDGEKTWCTNGVDDKENEFTEAILASAKYLVIAAHASTLNGVGGLQFAHQGGTSWGWKQTTITADWTGLQPTLGSYGAPLDFFIVIDLSTIPDWDQTSGGGGAKIILNSPTGWKSDQFVVTAAYVTSGDLVKPATFVDVKRGDTTYGWFAVEVPEMYE